MKIKPKIEGNMNMLRLKNLAVFVVTAGLFQISGAVLAQSVDAVIEADKAKVEAAAASQVRVNATADQADKIVQDFKIVNKEIEGLKAFNAQLELQIQDQERALKNLDQSIDNASGMSRDMAPLMEQMINALGQFIELDLPFDLEVRKAAVERLRNNIGRSDLSFAEKFRQVLEVYKIEADYSNNLASSTGVINVDGVDLEVNIIRVGRVALMYQSKDQAKTGFWNARTGQWEGLSDGDYRAAVATTLKIAKKQASIDILTLPVLAPQEAVQ